MINDSILVQALTEVEKEIQKKKLFELVQMRKSQREIKDLGQHLQEEEEDPVQVKKEDYDALISEDNLLESRNHEVLITEDELWERRIFEENFV